MLRVKPKQQTSGKTMEIRLLEECLRFPRIASRLFTTDDQEKVFEWWPDQAKIELEGDNTSGLVFLIIQYLQELQKLCRRHIKRKFPRVTRNITAKVKGRIDIAGNIRRNTVKGRPDRVYCNFNIHSIDILENRILKAALEVSKAFLRGHSIKSSHVWSMARECDTALAGVAARRIFPRHFTGLVLSGTMKPYKTPIKLAEAIIKNLGSEPDFDKNRYASRPIFPYAINMNELFERYCEVLLRTGKMKKDGKEINVNNLWAGNCNLGEKVKVRPDFLLWDKDMAIIADAKYKYEWPDNVSNTTGTQNTRPDVYQVMAYSRHQAVIKTLGQLNAGNSPGQKDMQIYIFYPRSDANEKCNCFKDFEIPIHALPIALPDH